MLHLHYHPGNASLAPHILLEELGEDYALRFVDRDHDAHKSPAYLRLNPNGLIPVLVHDAVVLYETAAILLHLADTHPSQPLIPPVGTAARAHFYKWIAWLSSTLQPTLGLWWYPERWADDEAGAAVVRARAEAKIGTMLEQLDAQLAGHDLDWLLGAHYSALDPYVLMLCRWTRQFERPARDYPSLGPYLQRVLARPAVQRSFEQEGLAQPWV